MGKANLELYGDGYQLQEEAHTALLEMKRDAYQDGIDIQVVSSYRSYERQRAIFERKYIQYTDEVIRAFDINKQEWRSFKVANVISFV